MQSERLEVRLTPADKEELLAAASALAMSTADVLRTGGLAWMREEMHRRGVKASKPTKSSKPARAQPPAAKASKSKARAT